MTATKLLKNTIFSGICVVLLGGCSWLQDWVGGDQSYQTEPQVKVVHAVDSTWIAPNSQTPPVTHMVPAQSDANKAAMDRIAALEEQVTAIRNDMKMMMPALTKLIGMQEAMNKIAPAAGAAPRQEIRPSRYGVTAPLAIAPPQKAPVPIAHNPPPVPAATPAPMPAQAQAQAGEMVRQIRFGEHSDKTRIVLDTSNDVAFSYDLDNGEQILMIELPTAGWSGLSGNQIKTSPLVAAYNAVPNGRGGTSVVVQLRKPARIIWAQALPPTGGSDKGPRIVIDLAAM